jgi:pimeloyl-ACP methyl ester carboxylesterase
MLTLPIPLLLSWLLGLLSLALLALSTTLLYKGARRCLRYERLRRKEYRERPHITEEDASRNPNAGSDECWRHPAILRSLILGAMLLLFTFAGRYLIQFAFPGGQDEPASMRVGTFKNLTRSDGTKIHAELYGPSGAPTLVLTHGWGTSSAEWYYAKRHLSDRFRLILWDLPGLGESTQRRDRNFALEQMASDLRTLLSLANGRRVVLVGHSIGGMINLTFCRLYPKLLGSQVAGIVQLDTTYTNPVKTTKGSGFSRAIQKPIAEPILHAMIPLSPFVRVMNWLSYQNGSAYLLNAQSSFGGSETRGQVDFVSQYQYKSSPAVVARGTLAMFHWDTTPVLPHVNTPVLIIVGQQDTTTLPSASEYINQSIPHSELRSVSPSAHYGLLEQNERYDAAVAQFASALLK